MCDKYDKVNDKIFLQRDYSIKDVDSKNAIKYYTGLSVKKICLDINLSITFLYHVNNSITHIFTKIKNIVLHKIVVYSSLED